MRKNILLIMCFIGGVFRLQAMVHYVNLHATGNNDGTTWANAYTDLQTAMIAASGGDSVFVATATYQPAIGISFSLPGSAKVFGGFIGTETSFNQRNLNNKATLLGNGSSVVRNENNPAAGVWDGFIITGGDDFMCGGINNISSAVTIRNWMIVTEIKIFINKKSDIDAIKESIIESNIQTPVYFFEYEKHYEIEFASDYEERELNSKIAANFPDYHFTTEIENGRKEIRLQISRNQSPLSTDGWGRQIETPLNETHYLVRKTNAVQETFNPNVKVLFKGDTQDYFIHVAEAIDRTTNQKGYLLFNDFKTANENNEAEILKDQLYDTRNTAIRHGYYKMQAIVADDFKRFVLEKQNELKALHKVPRKIVRSFINACNKNDINGILKDVESTLDYEKRIQLRRAFRLENVEQFSEYLHSPDQNLYSKDFKIRSWSIHLPEVTIRLKYSSQSTDPKNEGKVFIRYRDMSFRINGNNKIARITDDL